MASDNARNITLNTIGESIWGLQAAMVATATVVTVMLREFGASEAMIGSLVAIELGTTLLLQFIGPFIFASRRHRRRHLMYWHLFVMIPFWFLIAALVWFSMHLPSGFVRWGILICFAGFYCAIGIVLSAWTDWLAHIFGVTIRGTAMGLAFGGFSLAGIAGALLAGWLIKVFPSPQVYALLFTGAGVLAWISIIAYWNIKDPGEKDGTDSPPPQFNTILASVRESLRHANFCAFLVGRATATAGFCVLPFVTVYYTSTAGGEISNSSVVSFGAAAAVGTTLASLVLGKIGDMRGHHVGVTIGAAAQVVALLIVLFVKGPLGCIAAFACAGVAGGASFVSHFNMLFETCPHDNRIAHIMTGNMVIGAVGIVAASLGAWIANTWGVRVLFGISLVLSAVALLWFIFFVKEPRQTRAE